MGGLSPVISYQTAHDLRDNGSRIGKKKSRQVKTVAFLVGWDIEMPIIGRRMGGRAHKQTDRWASAVVLLLVPLSCLERLFQLLNCRIRGTI